MKNGEPARSDAYLNGFPLPPRVFWSFALAQVSLSVYLGYIRAAGGVAQTLTVLRKPVVAS